MTFSSVKYGVAPDEERADIQILCDEHRKYNHIDPTAFERYGVKRGLRNADGTGVLAGITNICNVHGYVLDEGEKAPIDGQLIYRGINVEQLVEGTEREGRYGYEEAVWLLLFGALPNQSQLDSFAKFLADVRELPDTFTEDMILKAPSPNIMNKLARSVLALYSYDDNPDETSLENVLRQSVELVARMPTIMVSAYQAKRRFYDHKSMYFHPPRAEHSIAQTILYTMRSDKTFTEEEARLLDKCMILHAEHGGGNNSTFATRVLTSSGTDTYSAIAGGIGALKGPLHGGANAKVMQMLDCIKENVQDWNNDDELAHYLAKIVNKEAGDGSGKIYGMGHAVYTKSDPRARILKASARNIVENSEYAEEFKLLESVERVAPQVLSAMKGDKKMICANVDLYSGMIYKMLRIPPEMYTPLFACSRIAGWCAHRIEEFTTGGRIIRPAYKAISKDIEYVPLAER